MLERLDYIDVSKGVGMILVVLGHSIPSNTVFCLCIFMFHVPLFFFLSGLTFNESRNVLFIPFLKKRARQILVPSFYFTILSLCVSKLLHLDFYSFTSLLYGLPHAMWFLPVLFIIEMLYHPISKIQQIMRKMLILLLFLFIGILLFKGQVSLPYRLSTCFIGVFYYGLGNLTRQARFLNYLNGPHKVLLWGMALVSLLLPFLCVLNTNSSIQFWNNEIPQPEVVYILLSLCGIIGAIIISSLLITPIKEVTIKIGRNSLIILCMHMLYMSIFRNYLNYTPTDSIYISLEIVLLILVLPPTIWLINTRISWMLGRKSSESSQKYVS